MSHKSPSSSCPHVVYVAVLHVAQSLHIDSYHQALSHVVVMITNNHLLSTISIYSFVKLFVAIIALLWFCFPTEHLRIESFNTRRCCFYMFVSLAVVAIILLVLAVNRHLRLAVAGGERWRGINRRRFMLLSEIFFRRTFWLSVKSEGKMKQVAAAVVVAAVIEWRWAAGKSIVRSWSVAGRGRGAVDGVDVADHHGGCRHCPLTLQYCQWICGSAVVVCCCRRFLHGGRRPSFGLLRMYCASCLLSVVLFSFVRSSSSSIVPTISIYVSIDRDLRSLLRIFSDHDAAARTISKFEM